MNPQWQSLLTDIALKPLTLDTPDQFICPLTENGVISLIGEQSKSYLQGQLSADVVKFDGDYLNSAHCDAKGKMWSISKILTIADEYLLTGHQDEMLASLEQLKKYGVFSKTTITDASEKWLTFGIGGQKAQALVANYQNIEPTQGKLIQLKDSGQQQYLLVLTSQAAQTLISEQSQHLYQQTQWTLAAIQAGIPHLTTSSINQYVPQMLNLQALNAISFTKGCYTGQEMVARMRYLGKNKRATYIVTGNASKIPVAGDELQLAVGDSWRRGGQIINIAGNSQNFYALVIMANDVTEQDKLRLKDDEQSQVEVQPLPYSLDVE